MDINNLIGNNLRTEGAHSGGKPRQLKSDPDRPAPKPEAMAGESVTLTETARTMSAAHTNASQAPFDSERVAQIKAAIAEGRYPIDNERLADRIIGFERLLD